MGLIDEIHKIPERQQPQAPSESPQWIDVGTQWIEDHSAKLFAEPEDGACVRIISTGDLYLYDKAKRKYTIDKENSKLSYETEKKEISDDLLNNT